MENQNQVLTKEELENQARLIGFSLINGEVEIDNESNLIELPKQKEFLDFHQHVENKLLFYSYEFEDIDLYLIPDEYQDEFESTVQEAINEKINEYNEMIKKFDFNKPSNLLMYYIKDGFLFFNRSNSKLFNNLSYSENAIDYIVKDVMDNMPNEKLEEIEKNRQAKIDEHLEKIKEEIFADPDFKTSTNDSLRRVYSHKFFKNNPEYNDLLREAGYYHPMPFIENTWREFKAKGLHK
ncbi:hypothetical protein [Metabacillus fastidiosus]|uniref:hypothetical protein n=1 Tax=Metabacillus fastidiosus TaxID=1458 RepID=UPI003D293EDB